VPTRQRARRIGWGRTHGGGGPTGPGPVLTVPDVVRRVAVARRTPPVRDARRSGGSATAARRKPAEAMGLADRLLALQRVAGNRATSLVVQALGEAPFGLAAISGQAAPELLDAEDVSRAKAFYRAQPRRYTPAVMERLHTHFGLPATAEPTTGMIKNVAIAQKQQGLKVDGKAGPRTLPQLFPSGLQEAERGQEFAGKAASITADWDRSPLPALRAISLVNAPTTSWRRSACPAATRTCGTSGVM
jgi:hypothetical protein